MTHMIRRSLAVCSVTLVAALAGCAVDETESSIATDEGEESVASVQSEVSTCPATTPEKIAMQRKVHRAFDYTFGGPGIFGVKLKTGKYLQNPNPCIDGSEAAVMEELNMLRDMFEDGTAEIGTAAKTNVCGIAAVSRNLHGTYHPYQLHSFRVWNAVQRIGQALDACWGPGASAFTFLGMDGTTVMIDPEPAKLTQTLTGSTGATVAAVLTNSETPTTVVKWTSAYTYNTTLVPGTPCATANMLPMSETLKVIQASGNYRRCI